MRTIDRPISCIGCQRKIHRRAFCIDDAFYCNVCLQEKFAVEVVEPLQNDKEVENEKDTVEG